MSVVQVAPTPRLMTKTETTGPGEPVVVGNELPAGQSEKQGSPAKDESKDGVPKESAVDCNAAETEVKASDGQLTEKSDADEARDDIESRNSKASVNGHAFSSSSEPSIADAYVPIPTSLKELKPTIRDTSFEHYKNFYTEEDLQPIIHTLYGGVSLQADVDKENTRRNWSNWKLADEPGAQPQEPDIETDVLHQIRIHSPCISERLYREASQEHSNTWRQRNFSRPFKPLIHYHPQMKEALERLEAKWGHMTDSDPAVIENRASDTVDIDGYDALIHMRVYVKFMEERVLPLYESLRGPNGTSHKKVMFTDLWYLFKEGELVYSPMPNLRKAQEGYGPIMSKSASQMSYQSCWRVYSIVMPEVPSDPRDIREDPTTRDYGVIGSDDSSYIDENCLGIWCYYIDYDGESYHPVRHQFLIRKFNGEKDIKSLPVYPLRFMPDEEGFKAKQVANGKTFMRYVEKQHVYHSGWTLTCSPTGEALVDVDKYPEHIESESIVDFGEGYQARTSWIPEFYNPEIAPTGTWGTDYWARGELLVRRYTPNRKDYEDMRIEIVQHDDIGLWRRNQLIQSDDFLSTSRRGDVLNLSGESLALLPKRLLVFSFMQRKFIHADIGCLKVIEPAPEIFDKLSINENHKLLVRSLVREHFVKKKKRHEGHEVQYQDLIRGKGTGLVFLLHGVPGVGKTATAEAIAQENRKPLFSITCADLGYEAGDVEKNLTRIFRLANLWDCILLLDEADIFFTKRTPTDLQRNALVTVFLRILEYYSGVLFLTTNRVGIIDEAFKSRIHMSLYYPPLDQDQYERIFKLNAMRVKEIEESSERMGERRLVVDEEGIVEWAAGHFKNTKQGIGRWNGRQIKNAFQLGASLAHYDLLDGEASRERPRIKNSTPGVLNAAQFMVVARTTQEFDEYMAQTKSMNDSALAKRDGIRNDERPAGNPRSDFYHGREPAGGPPPPGPGARYGQPPGPSVTRYSPPYDGYREPHGNSPYYTHEPRRVNVPDAYGQPPPQGLRQEMSQSSTYGYAGSSQGGTGPDVYENKMHAEGPGNAGQPGSDEPGYGYRREQHEWPQEGRRVPEGMFETYGDRRGNYRPNEMFDRRG